jgi:dephospho-CoA kinase
LKLFSDLGCTTLDADRLCAELHNTPGGEFHEKLCQRWGKQVISADGTTNRAAVAGIVFADPKELQWLEEELYPGITELAKRFFQNCPEKTAAIFEVPLLFERKWEIGLAGTIAVWSPEDVQKKRLEERGWSPEEIRRRCGLQFSADKKLELADYGIINDGSMEKLQQQCEILNRELFLRG